MLPFSSFFKPLVLRIGSTRAIILNDKKKVLFDAPARVALSASSGKILAFGDSAVDLSLLGAPDISVVPLFRDGIPVDADLCREYLLWMRDSFTTTRIGRVIPYPVVPVVPVGFAQPYKELFDSVLRSAHFFPLASEEAVVGDAWMELGKEASQDSVILIRLGATQTQVATLGRGMVIASHTIPIGGDELDRQFVRHMRTAFELSVPLQSIVSVKESYTKALVAKTPFSAVIRGKHAKRSDVSSVTLTQSDVLSVYTHFFEMLTSLMYEAMVTKLQYGAGQVRSLPIYLSGGLSLFTLASEMMESLVGEPVHVVSRPTMASVLGVASKRSESNL